MMGNHAMRALAKLKAEPGIWETEVPIPEVGPDDVLIRIKRTAICGTDMHIFNWDAWAQANAARYGFTVQTYDTQPDAVQAVRMAGYDDAQIVEIVQHVALNTWTNYVNSVAQTEIDFPVAQALAA